MVVLRGKNLGRCLSHEDGDFMNGISALRKEPQSFLDFPTMWRHSESGNRLSGTKSAVDCKRHIFIVCGVLLWQPEWNETLDDGFKRENTDSSNWGLRCRNRAIFKDSEILYVVWYRWLEWNRLNNHCSQRGLRTLRLEDCEHSKMMMVPKQRTLKTLSECGQITGDQKSTVISREEG